MNNIKSIFQQIIIFPYILIDNPRRILHKLILVCAGAVATPILYTAITITLPKSKFSFIQATALLGAILIIRQVAKRITKNSQSKALTYHGTAGWASKKDRQKLIVSGQEWILNGDFRLWTSNNKGMSLPRQLAERHIIIAGGSGTGKTRSYFLPNIAWSRASSFLAIDMKSELWQLTSAMHTRPIRFAPTDADHSAGFNPIPLCSNPRISELLARAIVESGNTSSTQQFWLDSETSFLSSLFSHASTLNEPTLLSAYRLFTRQKPDVLLNQLLNSSSEAAQEQAIIFDQTDPRIKGSIVPSLAAKLQFMRDPNVQRFTSSTHEAPEFYKMRSLPTAIYYCIHEQDAARLRPLTSLFTTLLLDQVTTGETRGVPITLYLDEFVNFCGKIGNFETTLSLARGRGVSIVMALQSIFGQLDARYSRDIAKIIRDNAATKIILAGTDFETAQYISNILGEATIIANNYSRSRQNDTLLNSKGGSTTTAQKEFKRMLLTPDEVRRIGRDEAIIICENKRPMRELKSFYDAPAAAAPTKPLGKARAASIQQQRELEQKVTLKSNRPLPPPL
jgi:type IV secretion system protein VirD4